MKRRTALCGLALASLLPITSGLEALRFEGSLQARMELVNA